MIGQSFEVSFNEIQNLVTTFRQNEEFYLSPAFSEAEARRDFIDKFWSAIGWDVNHETQTNPYEQEVKVEHGGIGNERRRRADYAFLAPNFRDVLFYVEAKKPSLELENRDHYFQTIRYGWNSHTSLAVLTDFEQFHILDCRYKPDIDSILQRGIKKYRYTDYTDPERFREIYHLFSREAVASGSLERFVVTLPKPSAKARQRALFATGVYQSVDESFLQKLDEYREELARAFKSKNPNLNGIQLTEVTQRTLDRLVFMRFLEDKLIETEPLVEELASRSIAWRAFIAMSARLDRSYNGIVFKRHDLLDAPSFQADEQVFTNICDSLSHINSPYDFNAIPIHILGSIYERFLGKTITVTNKEARIEEKPEVRKAGGVYYTPEYIVRHIVENTVGKVIKGKTPQEIRDLRFADIACGSGSFLLGVYDLLLRHHTAYYNASKRNRAEGLRAGCRKHEDGTLRLSLVQRREILLNNIYGVDIDSQAVEVAQLSLYLKLLEDETASSARVYQLELRDALLPSLSKNIVCGNSLIGLDILDGLLLASDEELKLKPMNFEDAFPQIMRAGGFDAIVGNPPYVRTERLDRKQLDYFRRAFSAEGQTDLYLLFIERALRLLKKDSYFGYITPKFLLFNLDAEPTRKKIMEGKITKIADVGQAFKGVNTECAVTILQNSLMNQDKVNIEVMNTRGAIVWTNTVSQESFCSLPNTIFNVYLTEPDLLVIRKMLRQSTPLGSLLSIKRGMEIGKKAVKGSTGNIKTLLGEDVGRYSIAFGDTYVEDDSDEVKRLLSHSQVEEKILIRRVCSDLTATIDYTGFFYTKNLYGAINQSEMSLLYLLGLINSRLMNYSFKKYFTTKKTDIFPEFQKYQLDGLPIRSINFSDFRDASGHEKMIRLVEQMIMARKQLMTARTDSESTYYQNKCTALDRQIDRLVYELYDLSIDEIEIVEAGLSSYYAN
jgi:type I restriction-modification system DNA methylase subunit